MLLSEWLNIVLTTALVSMIVVAVFLRKRIFPRNESSEQTPLLPMIESHFQRTSIASLTVSERQFPYRVRPDLHKSLDRLLESGTKTIHFCGVRKEYEHMGLSMSDCLAPGPHDTARFTPPIYEEIDIGEETPVRCLRVGLWFLERDGQRFLVMLSPVGSYGRITGIKFEIAVPNSPAGTSLINSFFKHLEEAVLRADSYRGKILSLEEAEHSYSGESSGITVHKLNAVSREQVILPRTTLDLLDRNVIEFSRQRDRLRNLGQATKKGLLFYGPPGTGKTHTIHYLTRALPGHTTLIVTAEQVGLLGEYMTLARLLQPSIVVIEDVDLIARDRSSMQSTCEEVLLNKLLNEMDGLKESADILFILTTNRPEALEAALASRPGRVDQAIEFPLPDEEGRAKLVRLYSQGVSLNEDLIEIIVRKTDRVSASFIKELMRRITQYSLERNGDGELQLADVENALDEMLFRGGTLNLKLLGAARTE